MSGIGFGSEILKRSKCVRRYFGDTLFRSRLKLAVEALIAVAAEAQMLAPERPCRYLR